jgi:hypothetical protein
MNSLRNIIRELIKEARVTTTMGASEDLAAVLARNSRGDPESMLVVFDPDGLNRILDQHPDDEPARLRALASAGRINMDFVVGMIEVASPTQGEAWGAKEVRASASNWNGYGPMLYDMALEIFGVVCPDRHMVSIRAQRVWKKYNEERPDVETLPFDDIEHPRTPPTNDDAVTYNDENVEQLDNAYKMKSPGQSSGTKSMLDRGKSILEEDPWLGEFLKRCADRIFSRRYQEAE